MDILLLMFNRLKKRKTIKIQNYKRFGTSEPYQKVSDTHQKISEYFCYKKEIFRKSQRSILHIKSIFHKLYFHLEVRL